MTTTKIGNTIIMDFKDQVKKAGADKMIQAQASIAMMEMYDIHARAIACHCECLGMDRDSGMTESEYKEILIKWKLMDKEGNTLI